MKIKSYLLFLLLISASSFYGQTGFGTGATTATTISSAGLTTGSVVNREYLIYIPSSYDGSVSYSLIFNFHGTGSNAKQQQWMSGFDKIADTANIIMVYPEGLEQPNSGSPPPTAWNSLGTVQENVDTDLKFVDDLLTHLLANYNINACKVYATGMSIGGFMTHDVGCFLNDKFAAIASVTGLSTHFSSCNPQHPTPVMQIHGDNDSIVPYAGFGGAGVDDIISYWANYNNCNVSATITPVTDITTADSCTATNHLYPTGDNGSTVELYKIAGGEHKWPTLGSTTSGQNGDFSASIEIWQFFRKYCLDDLNGTPAPCTPPSITAEPTDKTVCKGSDTSFEITASGTGLSYQWQIEANGAFNNLAASPPYSNNTTASLTVTNATVGMNGSRFRCIVTGNCNPKDTSAIGTLTVLSGPSADLTVTGSTISDDATVCPGTTSATITVNLTGTSPWSITAALDGTDQTPITNITTSPYTYTVDVAGVYTISSISDSSSCTGTNSGSVTMTENCGGTPCAATATISGDATICSGSTATISVALAGNGPWTVTTAIGGVDQTPVSPTTSPYTFSANSAGVYTISAVSDSDCAGTASGSATITENTTISTSTITETCNPSQTDYVVAFDVSGGDQSTYAVTGGTGSFSNSHFTSAAIPSGTAYAFTIDDANTCSTPISLNGTKTCNTGPCTATATISGGGTICNASKVEITVNLTGNPPWNFTIDPGNIQVTNQNTSPFIITSSVAGTYTITAISDNGCTGTSSGSALVENCNTPPIAGSGTVDIEEVSNLNDGKIFPNPSSGIINISIENANFHDLQISVVNLIGTTVFNEIVNGGTANFKGQIDLEHVASGLYYIRLSTESEMSTKKLIIQ